MNFFRVTSILAVMVISGCGKMLHKSSNGVKSTSPAAPPWTAMGTGMDGDDDKTTEVKALTTDSAGNVYAGGSFTIAGGVAANYIAKWNAATSTWQAMGTGMSGSVTALTTDSSGNVYAGGIFSAAGGVSANYIAKWNAATSTWTAMGTGMNGSVTALTTDSAGNVYAGGYFTCAGGSESSGDIPGNTCAGTGGVTALNGIAKWSAATSTWQAMGSGLNSYVEALTTDSAGNVYAGGAFRCAGGSKSSGYIPANTCAGTGGVTVLNGIAKWNAATSTWTAVGTGIGGNDSVDALTTDSSGNVYAGGVIHTAGGVSADSVAKWNAATSTWTAMGTGSKGMNGAGVTALTTDALGIVYAGGSFTISGGAVADSVAKWNAATSTWTAMGTSKGMNGGSVKALTTDALGIVYAGGSFTIAGGVAAGGVAAHYIAKWTGH